MGEFDRVAGAALGHGAKRGGVAEELGERDVGVDYFHAAAVAHFLDDRALRVKVADHFTHVVLRGDHLGLHDRFKDRDAGFFGGILNSHGTGDLKGHFRRVNIVVGTVVNGDLGVDDRVAGQKFRARALLRRPFRSV